MKKLFVFLCLVSVFFISNIINIKSYENTLITHKKNLKQKEVITVDAKKTRSVLYKYSNIKHPINKKNIVVSNNSQNKNSDDNSLAIGLSVGIMSFLALTAFVGIVFGIVARVCTKCKTVFFNNSTEISSSSLEISHSRCCNTPNNIFTFNDYKMHLADNEKENIRQNFIEYKKWIENELWYLKFEHNSLSGDIVRYRKNIVNPIKDKIDNPLKYKIRSLEQINGEFEMVDFSRNSKKVSTENCDISELEFEIYHHEETIQSMKIKSLNDYESKIIKYTLLLEEIDTNLREMSEEI